MKKATKIIAGLAGLLLLAGLLWLANGLVGNPVSQFLVKRAASSYLQENYADLGARLDDVSYSFKFGCYYARVSKPGSLDIHFTLTYSGGGTLRNDGYADQVLSGQNTYARLDADYRTMTDQVFQSPDFPLDSDLDYGSISFREDGTDFGTELAALEADREYDMQELGAAFGQLVYYAYDETVTAQRASALLLELKDAFDAAGVPFYTIDFHLEKPRTEDGPNPDTSYVAVENFRYADIGAEDYELRFAQAAQALKTANDAKDAEKMAQQPAKE